MTYNYDLNTTVCVASFIANIHWRSSIAEDQRDAHGCTKKRVKGAETLIAKKELDGYAHIFSSTAILTVVFEKEPTKEEVDTLIKEWKLLSAQQ